MYELGIGYTVQYVVDYIYISIFFTFKDIRGRYRIVTHHIKSEIEKQRRGHCNMECNCRILWKYLTALKGLKQEELPYRMIAKLCPNAKSSYANLVGV